MSKVVIENADGTEQELETVPSYEEPKEAYEGSGLYQSLLDFLPNSKEDDNKNNKGGEEPPAGSDKKPDEEPPPAEPSAEPPVEPSLVLEEMSSEQLIEEVKKNQRLLSEKDLTVKEFGKIKEENVQLKSELEQAKKIKVGDDSTAQAFFDEFRKDATAAFNKYKDKLNLPDFNLVLSQFTGGGHSARLKQHIETVIKPQIEKEFGMNAGEFKFDLAEAHEDPTSASAHFLDLKGRKQQELQNEVVSMETRERTVADAVKKQQATDLKWFADTYLGGDEAKVQEVWKEVESKALEVVSGKAKPEEHPLSLRYVLLGYKHKELVEEEVKKVAEAIQQEYTKLGMYLPGKEKPTDISGQKSATKPKEGGLKIGKSEYSPMLQNLEAMLEDNK